MKRAFYLLLLLSFPGAAQETGIHFDHGLSWEQVKAKAKKEKKMIFMDCFTTWCGPCRYMAANIFPQAEIGNFFNEHFVSVKVQLDTTQNDNSEVKSWYKSGADLARKYDVSVFPTYLFFDANGDAVHRSVGSSEAEGFLNKAKDAINPEKQYYTMLAKYNKGEKLPAFLLALARAAHECYDKKNMDKISNEYLATQKNLLTAENIQFLFDFTQKSTDMGFNIMQKNGDAFDAILGKGNARKRIIDIIKYNEIFPKAFNESGDAPDWDQIASEITKKYPGYAQEAIEGSKVAFYQNLGDWVNFQIAVVKYISDYGENITADELDGFAWAVFQNCIDIKCVEQALIWSKHNIDRQNNPRYIDTYANILYRLGKKDQAIQWEEKAMNLVSGDEQDGYKETIEKMKNGDKTWND